MKIDTFSLKDKLFKNLIVIFLMSTLPFSVLGIRPDSTYVFMPQDFGLIYKEFQVKTADNVSINVWFYPAQDTTGYGSYKQGRIMKNYHADINKKPTIIICNADANSMCYHIGNVKYLCPHGYNVVTFDWRGFAKSQKWKFDKNIACLEFLKDYNAVLDTVIQMKEVDNKRIGAYSFSTGAYISFLEFSLRSEIKALIVRGMFTSYKELIKNVDRIDPERIHPYPAAFDQPEYRAIDLAPHITKPIMLIVGEHDVRTPPEMSIALLSNRNSFIRDLWIVKGAEHGGQESPEVIDWKGFKQRTLDFYQQNL